MSQDKLGLKLTAKIESRQTVISVIGLGYVGLPLAVTFAEAGFTVTGIDTDVGRVDAVNSGESYVHDVPSEALRRSSARLSATIDYATLADSDVAIICVPTPLGKTRDPDVSFIVSAVDDVATHLHSGMLVVLESTTYPGTTEELVLPRLHAANGSEFRVGVDFFLAFSPERFDPGQRRWTIANTPKVIGGTTPRCLQVATALYRCIVDEVVPVSSPKVAEVVKLLENTFRATNIALVNEFAIICDKLGVDVWEVIEAAKTKPFGFMPFYPGPGLGGHCVPVDPQYLAWKLKTLNYSARFIQLAEEINFGMPRYVVGKIVDSLNEDSKALKGSRILVLGVTYKADVSDTRESPALDVIHLLREKGAEVAFNDPYVTELEVEGYSAANVELTEDNLAWADCTVIATAHASYDWEWIVANSRLVVDTRNATAGVGDDSVRVVKL